MFLHYKDPHKVLCSGYLWFGEPAGDQAALVNGMVYPGGYVVKCQVAEPGTTTIFLAAFFWVGTLGWALGVWALWVGTWGGRLGWALWVGTLGWALAVPFFRAHTQGTQLKSQHLCSCFVALIETFLFSPCITG